MTLPAFLASCTHRSQSANPAQLLAFGVDQGIYSELCPKRISPAQASRTRELPSPQEGKHGGGRLTFCIRSEKPEVPNCMTVAIMYVIGKERDKLLNWILGQNPFLLLKVLPPELDYAIVDLLKAVLCYRRAANVSAGISQKLPLCLEVSDVNAPPTLELSTQGRVEVASAQF